MPLGEFVFDVGGPLGLMAVVQRAAGLQGVADGAKDGSQVGDVVLEGFGGPDGLQWNPADRFGLRQQHLS